MGKASATQLTKEWVLGKHSSLTESQASAKQGMVKCSPKIFQ